MKRADQQELLAAAQRKELERLRWQQKTQLEKDRTYIATQRARERDLLAKQYKEKEALIASREQKYRGQWEKIRGRASDLDANNRDLHAELAQSERDQQMLRDELNLVKGRLNDTTQQLSQTRNVSQETGRRLQALQASAAKRKGNASIRANTSIGSPIEAIAVPGMDIREDGDLVRIAIPTDKMFMTGTDSLHQGSRSYLDQVASIVQRHYPRQMIGVESHTDHGRSQVGGTQWRSQHQLTANQAMKVFDQLTARSISPHQLFVLGHGGNHPRVSDGTPPRASDQPSDRDRGVSRDLRPVGDSH